MEDKENRDYTGAIFLVLLGTLFLLNTTGVVSWGIWLYLLKFWPIIIILIGLRMVLPKNTAGNIIMAVLYTAILLMAGIFAYFYTENKKVPLLSERVSNYIFDGLEYNNEVQTQEEYILTEDYEGVTDRMLDIFIGASEITLDDQDEDYFLFSKTTYQYEGDLPDIESNLKEGLLSLGFSNKEMRHWGIWRFVTPKYELSLGNTTTPTSLDLTIGAGSATVNLDKVLLKEVYAEVGAGELDMTLGSSSIPEKLDIEIGAGEMTISIPETVGVSLVYNLGVGEIQFDSQSIEGLNQKGTYNTSNYDTADIKLIIDANVGVGELNIERI